MALSLAVLLVLTSCAGFTKASTFLASTPTAMVERMSEHEVRMSFLAEVENGLGTSTTNGRLDKLEALLRPMYAALPKNEFGRLGHAATRYALHRLFVQRHGWFIKGLEPSSGGWNTSSPTGILKDRVPSFVHGLFEERLHGHGLGLHELSVLAATLEHLIHDEAHTRMSNAYRANGFSPTAKLMEDEVDLVLQTYIMFLLRGSNVTTTEQVVQDMKFLEESYPGWEDTKQFARDIRQNVAFAERYRTNPFVTERLDYPLVEQIVEEFGEQFGHFQDGECSALKNLLLSVEDGFGSGRVQLSQFYKLALNGVLQFGESAAYLRELGALDESNSKDPHVIIANYMNSQANCISSSSFYAICCIDECEKLLNYLEQEVAAPTAEPQRVAELVAGLSSSTIDAPRNLSTVLLQRLEEVAANHQGVVPLHGRLFAQWMHHAFPRECRFPLLSGSISPATPHGWMQEKGEDPMISEEHMKQFLDEACLVETPKTDASIEPTNSFDIAKEEMPEIPWLPVEELVVAGSVPVTRAGHVWAFIRPAMLMAAFVSMSLGMKQTLGSSLADVSDSVLSPNDLSKYCV